MLPTIIVVGFSRPQALKRLLHSLNKAHYPLPVLLNVSLDGGTSKTVIEVAESFEFKHGEYRIIKHEQNMGLREHILWCGDQTATYGAVIVLEDDLIVDPYFFFFAVNALQAYANNPSIAGIALYSPRYNEYTALPFEPLYNGQSAFLMTVPCSSGQLWTHTQWQAFRKWYGKGEQSKVDMCVGLPMRVKQWPKSSWKKYYAAYLVDESLFFIYPYISYTSNCSDDGGTHIAFKTDIHQTALGQPDRKMEEFVLRPITEESLFYDAYMEICSSWVEKRLNLPANSLVVDLYASKDASLIVSKPFALTSRPTKESIMKYPLDFRPMEMNIFYTCEDSSLGFFSLSRNTDVLLDRSPSRFAAYQYWIRIPFSRTFFQTIFTVFLTRLKNKLTRLTGRLFIGRDSK